MLILHLTDELLQATKLDVFHPKPIELGEFNPTVDRPSNPELEQILKTKGLEYVTNINQLLEEKALLLNTEQGDFLTQTKRMKDAQLEHDKAFPCTSEPISPTEAGAKQQQTKGKEDRQIAQAILNIAEKWQIRKDTNYVNTITGDTVKFGFGAIQSIISKRNAPIKVTIPTLLKEGYLEPYHGNNRASIDSAIKNLEGFNYKPTDKLMARADELKQGLASVEKGIVPPTETEPEALTTEEGVEID